MLMMFSVMMVAHLDDVCRVDAAITPVHAVVVGNDEVDDDNVPVPDVETLLEVVDVDDECECR